MTILFTEPSFVPVSGNSVVYPGAKLYFYETGTSTLQNTYSEYTLTTAHANPVVADADGRFAPIYLDPSLEDYKVVLKDSSDVTIWTVDPYSAVNNTTNLGTISGLLAASTALGTVSINGYHTPGDGGGGEFYWDASQDKANHNGGTVIDPDITYPTDWTNQTQVTTWFTAGTGTGCWVRVYDGPLNAKWFGVVGDGAAVDGSAVRVFLNSVDGNSATIPAGTYNITSLLEHSLNNTHIKGVRGATKITTSLDLRILRLLDCENVIFEDIEFESTFTNAVDDGWYGLVYATNFDGGNNPVLTNVQFIGCKFTAPDCHANGIALYARRLVADTTGSCTGLVIRDCDFIDIGRIAVVLMNRGANAADKYTAFQNVLVRDNRAKNLGLKSAFGFFVTLDGVGQGFEISHNYITNAKNLAIENTGWSNGTISYNVFTDFSTNSYYPISATVMIPLFYGALQERMSIIGNRTIGSGSKGLRIQYTKNCIIKNNYIDANSGEWALQLEDCSEGSITNNHFVTTNQSVIKVTSRYLTGNDNVFDGNFLDNSGGTNTTVIDVNSVAGITETKNNSFINTTFNKGTGGVYMSESSSSLVVENYHIGSKIVGSNGMPFDHQVINFPADTFYVLNPDEVAARYIEMTDTGGVLTGTTDIVLPAFRKQWIVKNSTSVTIRLFIAGGTPYNISPGTTVNVFSDGQDFVPV